MSRLDEIEKRLGDFEKHGSLLFRLTIDDTKFLLSLARRQAKAIEEMKKALNNSLMAFADCASRVKAPEPYMLEDIKAALAKVAEILK